MHLSEWNFKVPFFLTDFFFIEIRLYLLCLRRDCDTKNQKSGSLFSLKMQLSFRQELILQVVLRFHRCMLKWFSREIIIYTSIRVIHFLIIRDKKIVKMPWSSIDWSTYTPRYFIWLLILMLLTFILSFNLEDETRM